MKISVDVVDFGSVVVGDSPDNLGHIRLEINDSVEGTVSHADFTPLEFEELCDAMQIVLGRVNRLY